MRIAVFGNTYRDTILSHIRIILDYFKDKEAVFLLDPELYDYVAASVPPHHCRLEIIKGGEFNAGLAVSIGGDGTFLNTAARVGAKQIPILGINLGRLGFLADIADSGIINALDAFVKQDYIIEERTLLFVETSDGTTLENPFALNEIAVLKQDASSMISVNTSVNNQIVHTYQADGLLISTPTGSTAYSLSVGGPIVVPQAQSFLLSPVASHSLNVRPLIIPDTWDIELQVFSRTNSYMIAVDGRSKVLDQRTRLKISKADYTIKVVKQKDYTFFDTLKNKLMWGVDKRN